jgi:hypothetical protein
MDDHAGSAAGQTGTCDTTGTSDETVAAGPTVAAGVDMGPQLSFTFRPMELDAIAFTDAGFATANNFPPGHFDEPEDQERLAERIVADPAPHAGTSILSRREPPPSNEAIEATLAIMREQLQALCSNDALRRHEIADIRQASQAANARLDDTELRVNDLVATFAHLSAEQGNSKHVLDQMANQLGDFVRYFTQIQASTPASKYPSFAIAWGPGSMSGMEEYTNSPSFHQFAEDIFTGIFSTAPFHGQVGTFDSASHACPSCTPVTRRTASNVLPRGNYSSSTKRAKRPRAASAIMTRSKSSYKGKDKGKGKARDDEDEDVFVEDPVDEVEGMEDMDVEEEEDVQEDVEEDVEEDGDDIDNAEWEED